MVQTTEHDTQLAYVQTFFFFFCTLYILTQGCRYPWHACVQAFFLRYPNPQASHILSVDVVDRRIEMRAKTSSVDMFPVLCTSRLILKSGSLPSWAPKNIIQHSTSWVLEESEVDLSAYDPAQPRVMSIWTRNLDHTSVLAVTEALKFQEPRQEMQSQQKSSWSQSQAQPHLHLHSEPPPHPQLQLQSQHLTHGQPSQPPMRPFTHLQLAADVRSAVSFKLLRYRIEKFGLKRYMSHVESSRNGLIWVITRMAPHLASVHTEHMPPHVPPPPRRRLLNALRPPFLDGYPETPWQWLKKKWRQWRGAFRRTPTSST